MNKLSVFEYNGQGIRIIEQDGEPWFVAKDLCGILGIGNPSQSMSRLDDDEKKSVCLTDGTPGNPNTTIVSESGMYTLVLSSRKPGTKPLRKAILKWLIEKKTANSIFDIGNGKWGCGQDNSGFIYLAQASQTRWCKIGMSKHPYKRMSSLQTGSPLEIILIHRIFTFDMVALEKSLHDYYAAYSLRGEWFDLPAECIREFPAIANELDSTLEQVCLPQ